MSTPTPEGGEFSGAGIGGQEGVVVPIPPRAGGGPISGPGSGTSDSIPAWLSNGEFVQIQRYRPYRLFVDV
jgi:hypothetical protein